MKLKGLWTFLWILYYSSALHYAWTVFATYSCLAIIYVCRRFLMPRYQIILFLMFISFSKTFVFFTTSGVALHSDNVLKCLNLLQYGCCESLIQGLLGPVKWIMQGVYLHSSISDRMFSSAISLLYRKPVWKLYFIGSSVISLCNTAFMVSWSWNNTLSGLSFMYDSKRLVTLFLR